MKRPNKNVRFLILDWPFLYLRKMPDPKDCSYFLLHVFSQKHILMCSISKRAVLILVIRFYHVHNYFHQSFCFRSSQKPLQRLNFLRLIHKVFNLWLHLYVTSRHVAKVRQIIKNGTEIPTDWPTLVPHLCKRNQIYIFWHKLRSKILWVDFY